jgi:sulfotransferase family protein
MGLQVIGVGLGRTGTLSLKIALEQLGLGPCYHMAELMMNPERAPLWVAAADGKPDWEAVFKGYSSSTDYPACLYWRELAVAYPSAKLILTKRDKDKWFESTQATIFSEPMSARIRGTPMEPFFEKTVWRDFGARIHDRGFMTTYFEKHNAAVEAGVEKKRLLVYDVAQGWAPLCEFLGVAAPDAPFPKVNSREEMQARMSKHTDPDSMMSAVREHLQDAMNKH